MKNLKFTGYKPVVMGIILSIFSVAADAQKLPTEQQISLRAPADIKIDGKATEWNNKFQAYNKHTDFYYTISNDDNNLYVTIQATDPSIASRIIMGGITFTVNKLGKKNEVGSIRITYPLLSNKFFVFYRNAPQIIPGSATSVMQADSFMNATNKKMEEKSKTIRVYGIKNIDTIVSVYNSDGIKAAALYDNKMVYTYELAVSFKDLDLSISNPVKFAYQLMINEVAGHGITRITDNTGKITGINITGPNPVPGQDATDFWGEYILAK